MRARLLKTTMYCVKRETCLPAGLLSYFLFKRWARVSKKWVTKKEEGSAWRRGLFGGEQKAKGSQKIQEEKARQSGSCGIGSLKKSNRMAKEERERKKREKGKAGDVRRQCTQYGSRDRPLARARDAPWAGCGKRCQI